MPSRAWVVTYNELKKRIAVLVSMPSRAWVVTRYACKICFSNDCFNALTGLSCYGSLNIVLTGANFVSMPSRAWVVTQYSVPSRKILTVSMPSRAWVVTDHGSYRWWAFLVSMPSRAWVVTCVAFGKKAEFVEFQCPHGLELLLTLVR